MILVLIPVAAIFLGLGLWAALRGMGALNVLGAEGTGPLTRSRDYSQRPRATSVREWFTLIRPGWLIAVIAVCGLWILGWLIILLVGLSFLS
ncbi:MAG: hypothetical protein ACRD2W_10625 [Acidimicrobiales bacterium]